jgi:hypothetical protein
MTSDLDTGQATLLTALVAMQLALADDAVVGVAAFQGGRHTGTGDRVSGLLDRDTSRA